MVAMQKMMAGTDSSEFKWEQSGPSASDALRKYMQLCSRKIGGGNDGYRLYGEDDWEFRQPVLMSAAARGYCSVLRLGPQGGVHGGVTLRVLSEGCVEIVMLRVDKPGFGVGSKLVREVQRRLKAIHRVGATILLEAVDGPENDKEQVVRFFSRCGFKSTQQAADLLQEVYLEKELAFYQQQGVNVGDDAALDAAREYWTRDWDGKDDEERAALTFTWNTLHAPNKMIWRAGTDELSSGDGGGGNDEGGADGSGGGTRKGGSDGGGGSSGGCSKKQHTAPSSDHTAGGPAMHQTRSMPSGGKDEPHQVLITRGAAAYDAAVGTPPERRGEQPYDGPTLRNGRVCIRASEHGGKGGRGLFPGPDGLKACDAILYSGEVVSASEAKARKERGEADYILQLGFRDDSDRIDGCPFANAISSEPDAQGRYLPLDDWALDAGPGCMANEDKQSPNAKFELRWLDKKRDFGPYRVIVPLRDIGAEEEIRPKYGSDTPRGKESDARSSDAFGGEPIVPGLVRKSVIEC
jgi:uncharacterized membrane protein YgcG